MRVGCVIVATVAFFRTFASAEENSDENERCPLYGNGTRALDTINPSMRWLEDGPGGTGKAVHRSIIAVKSIKNLRGVHRQLDKNYNFQLKVYWEEGYCWQNEWKDRKWCLECDKTSCEPDSHLWLKKCDVDEKKQRFTYEIINATTQAVKISPLDQKDLCWTAIEDKEMIFKNCGDSYKDNVTGIDKQVLIGFAEGGRFQLHPNGFAESNTNVYKCISSHLHPKEEDIIYADLCEPARALNTSRLIVFNAEGPSQTPPPSPPTPFTTDVGTSSPDSLSGGDISAPTASPSAGTMPLLLPMQSSAPSEASTPFLTSSPTNEESTVPTVVIDGEESTASPTLLPTAAATLSPSPPTPFTTDVGTSSPDSLSGGDISAPTASPSAGTMPLLLPMQSSAPSEASTPFPTSSPTNKESTVPTVVIDGEESTASPTLLPTAVATLSPSASRTEAETPSEEKTESPTKEATADDDALPKVKAVSGSYCTPRDPCAQCYGDCDTDLDCQDNLQCYQRDGGQAVPSCRGGEDSISDTDYCIDPSWEDATPRAEEETASPTGEDETAWPSDGDTSSPSASPTKEEETARPSDGEKSYPTLSPTEQPSAETAFPTED